MKRILSIALAILMVLAPVLRAENETDAMAEAVKSYQPFELNGEAATIGGYLINGNNYYKLRDVAALLNETDKKFNVVFDDEKKQIGLVLGEVYEKLDTDLQEMKHDKTEAQMLTNIILVDGKEVELKAAVIDGNNYVKLRDIGRIVGFLVAYNKETKAIVVDTSAEYKEEEKSQEKAEKKNPNASPEEIMGFLSKNGLKDVKDGGLLIEEDWYYLIIKSDQGEAVKVPVEIYQEMTYENIEDLLDKQTAYLANMKLSGSKDDQYFVKNTLHYYFLKADRFAGESLDTLSLVDDFGINVNQEHMFVFDLFKNNVNIPYYLTADKKEIETAPFGTITFVANYSDGSTLESAKLEDCSKIPFYTADKKGRLTSLTFQIGIQDFRMYAVVAVI